MHRGPVILEDLCSLLLRFRTKNVAVVADIEKAFLQISLQPESRDVTRFLWLKDISKPIDDDNLITYRFTRVPFGIICSPFLLSGSIQHYLRGLSVNYASKLLDDLYVDNVVSGEETPREAIELYVNSKKIFQGISMNLREWASNSTEVMKAIPKKERVAKNPIKVLGLDWDSEKDTINVRQRLRERRDMTKRQILKSTAEAYDPLGLLTPVTLQAKLLLRNLWKQNQ